MFGSVLPMPMPPVWEGFVDEVLSGFVSVVVDVLEAADVFAVVDVADVLSGLLAFVWLFEAETFEAGFCTGFCEAVTEPLFEVLFVTFPLSSDAIEAGSSADGELLLSLSETLSFGFGSLTGLYFSFLPHAVKNTAINTSTNEAAIIFFAFDIFDTSKNIL